MFQYTITFITILIPINIALSGGAKVTIVLQTKEEITGELLAFTENTLIITKNFGINEVYLKEKQNEILKLELGKIREIIICGKSYLLDGITLGLMAGITIGTLIAFEPRGWNTFQSNYDEYGPGFKGIVICAFGGALLGALAGGTASTDEKTINLNNKHDLLYLKQYARYKDTIPEFLEQMIR